MTETKRQRARVSKRERTNERYYHVRARACTRACTLSFSRTHTHTHTQCIHNIRSLSMSPRTPYIRGCDARSGPVTTAASLHLHNDMSRPVRATRLCVCVCVCVCVCTRARARFTCMHGMYACSYSRATHLCASRVYVSMCACISATTPSPPPHSFPHTPTPTPTPIRTCP